MREWQNALYILGILLCLIGAIFMTEGRIFGENNAGISIGIGIIGICFVIGSSWD